MKRAIPLLLLCLLLLGCGKETRFPHLSFHDAAQPPASAVPSGTYDPDSPLTRQYSGALQAYPLGRSDITGIRVLGSGILVFSGTETTTLTVLSGDSLICSASLELGFFLDPQDPSLRLQAEQFSFYDPMERQILVLDQNLEILSRIPVPDTLQGSPILSDDGSLLYYCTGTGIRVWDRTSSFQRCIREMSCSGQTLTGIALQGSILSCQYQENGVLRTLYISARTGELLAEQPGEASLFSSGDAYFAVLPKDLGQTLVWGTEGASPQFFLPKEGPESCRFLPSAAGAVTAFPAAPGQLRLEYYDLPMGKRLSSLTLPLQAPPSAIDTDQEGRVLLLVFDPDYGCDTLYRWTVSGDNALALRDGDSYTVPYQQEDTPDLDGLIRCRTYAHTLGEKHGIQIRVWEEAAAVQAPGYDLTPEYQTGILYRELQLLERRLENFPEALLADTISQFSKVTICIVREIRGAAESDNRQPAALAQFFRESEAYIVIAAGQYSEGALYQGLYPIMETRLLTRSNALDQWESFNPFGFRYSYGGSGKSMKAPEYYLLPENRAFADTFSTDSPTADRAAILREAMLPGNQALFQCEILQAKLSCLCSGIRQAYQLQEHPEAFLWEQYLSASPDDQGT